MRVRRYLLALALVVGASCADRAFGQLGYTLCSLDWLVASADVVVLGTIAEASREPDGERWEWVAVTLEVHEMLKGDAAERLTFAARVHRSNEFVGQSREAQRELLWFLQRKDSTGVRDHAGGVVEGLTDGELHADLAWGVIPFDRPESAQRPPPPIFTIDLRLLETRDDILRAAREAVAAEREGPGRVFSHEVDLPRGIAQRTGSSGDANRFVVPVDRRLEAFARRLIQSPEQFLGTEGLPTREDVPWRNEAFVRSECDWLRYEGVKALKYFKSDENAALLMPLLDDTAFRLYHSADDGPRTRVYHVRKAAREALIQWDVIEGVVREDLLDKNR